MRKTASGLVFVVQMSSLFHDSSSEVAASACACSAGACSVGIRTRVCGNGGFVSAASPSVGFGRLAIEDIQSNNEFQSECLGRRCTHPIPC